MIDDDSSSDDADFVKIPTSEHMSKELKKQRNIIKTIDPKTIPRGQVIRTLNTHPPVFFHIRHIFEPSNKRK